MWRAPCHPEVLVSHSELFWPNNAPSERNDDGKIRHMAGIREAGVGDLYRVPGKAELVNGELSVMSPGGGSHGYAAGVIYASLLDHARRTKRGIALPDNVGFIVNLPNRRSFCPDAAFWNGAPLSAKFLEGSPIFAVEVRSAEDYGPAAERAVAAKRADYFTAGTLAVWDVDLRAMQVHVYRSTDLARPSSYGRGQQAEAEPAVPGWSMPVDDLIPPQ
jgi:Uma2 family endonuclease